MSSRSALALAALGLALASSGAAAQEAPRQVLSINPIGAVFGVYMGEFERVVRPNTTAGVSATYWNGDLQDGQDAGAVASYLTVDAKLRYYPGATQLKGFSIGGSVGYTGLSGELTTEEGEARGEVNTLGAGVELDYNWLLGARDQVMVGTGVGAKRLYVLGDDVQDVALAYPTLRLVVGYAF